MSGYLRGKKTGNKGRKKGNPSDQQVELDRKINSARQRLKGKAAARRAGLKGTRGR